MRKKIFLGGMLVILLVFNGTTVFAQRQVSSRQMSRLVNDAVASSNEAYELAQEDYDENEDEIAKLVYTIGKKIIAINRLTDQGENLTSSQERQMETVNANLSAIQELQILAALVELE
jgi:hypothetical protein